MLIRIYCRRKRDGVWLRFNSRHAMLAYSRANNENRRSLPVEDRSKFIEDKKRYENPQWIRSCKFEGMAMLTDARGGVTA